MAGVFQDHSAASDGGGSLRRKHGRLDRPVPLNDAGGTLRVELGGAGYDIYAMANSWLTMALNGCGWLLVVVLLTPRMESLRQKVGGGDAVWLCLITCSASIGLFGYMASQYYNKIVVDPAQAWSCIAGTVVMVACVKFSKKMPWLKEYGLGIAIVIGIVVGALVR